MIIFLCKVSTTMFQPLEHQLAGLEWMQERMSKIENRGFLLADEMGVGKTIQIGLYLKESKIPKRADLIVCPGAVVDVWVKELNRIKDYPAPGPAPKICTFHGSNRMREYAEEKEWDYIITTYGILTTESEFLQGKVWGRIVLDESHSIKNGGGNKVPKRAKAAFDLAHRAKHRICISGTPFNNRITDVASQARFIGTQPYADPSWWRANGTDPIQLKRWQNQCMLRRTKDDLGLGLRKPIYHDVLITPTNKEGSLVESMRNEAAKEFKKWKTATGTNKAELQVAILSLIMKLRIASNTFYRGDDDHTPDDVMRDCAKINRLVSDVDQRLWEDERKGVVIFSEFSNKTFNVLEEILLDQLPGVDIMRFTGKETMTEKNEVVEYFNTSSHPRIILASLTAGGTGISLHHGSASVFIVEPYYHPFMELQAEERVHRIGQKEQVHVYRYTMNQSIELWMQGVKIKKAGIAAPLSLAEETTGGCASFEEIAKLFTDYVSISDAKPKPPTIKSKNNIYHPASEKTFHQKFGVNNTSKKLTKYPIFKKK